MADEVDLLVWPEQLGPQWQRHSEPGEDGAVVHTVTHDGEPRGTVTTRRALTSALRTSYPGAEHDQVLEPSGSAPAEAVQLVAEALFAAHPECRRLVLAAPVDDLAQIDRAERAGLRYVVDVDLPGQELSLLAAEPDWVLAESRGINTIPTS